MKSLLHCVLLFALIPCFSGCVSQQAATKEEMNHEYIVEYPGLAKSVIFNRTLKWIANNFRSSKSVIQYQDSISGSIIGNCSSAIKPDGSMINLAMSFTMNIDIKENKARYRFINLNDITFGDPSPMPDTKNWHRPAREIFDDIVSRLKTATNKSDDF